MAQLVVIPMMGMPVFSGSVVMATGSLVGHLVFGGVLGAIYGRSAEAAADMSAGAGAHRFRVTHDESASA